MHCVRVGIVGLALCSIAFAQSPEDHQIEVATASRAQPTVMVFLDFEQPGPAATIAEMKREAEQLLKPASIQLAWRTLGSHRHGDSYPDLAVFHFLGDCSLRPAPRSGRLDVGEELGSTKVSDGKVLPFASVECENIRRSIGLAAIAFNAAEREVVMGRALGRVVAHELYHILLQTREHLGSGVAKSCHTRNDLISDNFRFSTKVISLIRAAKVSPVEADAQLASR